MVKQIKHINKLHKVLGGIDSGQLPVPYGKNGIIRSQVRPRDSPEQ